MRPAPVVHVLLLLLLLVLLLVPWLKGGIEGMRTPCVLHPMCCITVNRMHRSPIVCVIGVIERALSKPSTPNIRHEMDAYLIAPRF